MNITFCTDDNIVIQEVFDGLTVGITYSDGKVLKTPASFNDIYQFDDDKYADLQDKQLLGVWFNKPVAARYNTELFGKWFVTDIFDTIQQRYLTQREVLDFCIKHDLLCIDIKYMGKFKSMAHCRHFVHQAAYGEHLKGIVVTEDGGTPQRRKMMFLSELYEDIGNGKIIDITKVRT